MTVELRCPECRRFLGEVDDYGRLPCPKCGCEIVYRSKQKRKEALTGELPTPKLVATTT